jgi:hypothetical protein
VSPLAYLIGLSGFSAELCLAWRVLRKEIWRAYPYFSSYVIWVLLHSIVSYPFPGMSPTTYRTVYWVTDVVDIALRFLIVWEVFRHTFPKDSALHRVVSRGFFTIAFGLGILSVGTLWSYVTYAQFHSVYPAFERSFSFAQAVMILGILLTTRYYDVQLGRNIRGIALAFGAWSSITTANYAMIDLRHSSFLPYLRMLKPLSFLAIIGVWIWAVWVYEPNPVIETASSAELSSDLAQWTEGWEQATSTVRRVMHP